MFRALLAYRDINTKTLLRNKFERDGFLVLDYAQDSLEQEGLFDIFVCEDSLISTQISLNIPTIKIMKENENNIDSDMIVYVTKPFRPSEVLLKALLLVDAKSASTYNCVKKIA